MPRGKRLVFAGFCKECNARIDTARLYKQNKKGVSWKEEVADRTKYCPVDRKRVGLKYKEEKHSS